MNVLASLGFGLVNVFHPRMLWLMIWPMLVSLAVWVTVAFFLWSRLAVWIAEVLKQWAAPIAGWAPFDLGTAATFIANFMLLVLFFPLVYLTALFILGIFGMDKMVDHVATQMSPSPERRRGGGTAGSIWNGIVSLTGIVLLFLVSLPLWLVPPLGPIAVLAILSWVNQRLLRYDAVSQHADKGEMHRLFREHRGGLYSLGLLLALAGYIPFLNLLAPVVFGLAFIRYLLGALIELRYESNPNKALAGGNAPL
ncbi:MAG TPA: EI24 domain-containing protein [Burkholderiales bacterium]|nr:EI24 domain-containing protein [Burkholderiales bacterium]